MTCACLRPAGSRSRCRGRPGTGCRRWVPAAGRRRRPGEALALFTDRARRSDARFGLDGDTGQLARRLVARLDGMPLAIELAAARVEALGLASWWTGSRTASGC